MTQKPEIETKYKYLFLLLLLQTSNCLKAYDCTDPSTKYAEVSLKEVGQCSEVGRKYKDPISKEIQVIKRIRANNFQSQWCRMKIDLEIYNCGWDGAYSYVYPGPTITTNEIIEIPKAECERAHSTRRMTVSLDDSTKIEIKLPQSNHISKTTELKGDIEKNGACTGKEFEFRDTKYRKSILKMRYTAEIKEVQAIYDSDTDKVIIPNKIQTKADPLYVADIVHGTYVWTKSDLTKATKCDDFQQIIKGKALIYEPANDTNNVQTIVMLENTNRRRHAALIKLGAQGACGHVVYSTQLEDILLNIVEKDRDTMNIKDIDSLNTDKFINIEALISQAHLSSELKTAEAFSKITSSICETNRLRLQDSINGFAKTGAGLSNTPEGTISLKAGSTAYIFKCAEIEVTLRFEEHSQCTHEIPIWVNGPEGKVKMYADPVTLVIVTNATRSICTSITPIKWALPDKTGKSYDWYCSTPKITKCPEPTILDPMIIKDPVFSVSTHNLMWTLFDKSQLQSLSLFQNMGNVRTSITSKLTTDIMKNKESQDTGYNIIQGIPDEQLGPIKEKLTPFSSFLGKIWQGCGHLIITCFVIRVIASLVLLLTRVHRMIQLKGISLNIFYAFISDTFHAAINAYSHNCCPCKHLDLDMLKKVLKSEDITKENESIDTNSHQENHKDNIRNNYSN